MIEDYSVSLIEIDKAIIQFRKCVLKNDFRLALYFSEQIVNYANNLDGWTENEVAKRGD